VIMDVVVKNLNQTNGLKKGRSNVVCRKCKSDQIVANKRGYSIGLMFKVLFSMVGIGIALGFIFFLLESAIGDWLTFYTFPIVALILFLSLPISLLCGFNGRNSLVNGCMKCGNKWIAGKK